jgi:hypothetical protein
MIRCTIELLPGGDEDRKRTIGLVEIANVGGTHEKGNYVCVLAKTPPFAGALRRAWKKGMVVGDPFIQRVVDCTLEDAHLLCAEIEGHPRQSRGVYDLLYRAFKACGLEARIPADQR